jgi:hypothetical protein
MSPTALPTNKRDQRLDFLRGLALITIFVNHVPGTFLENLTSRNFGFSDAAEAFVLMSGIAAAFAYTKAVRTDFAQGFSRAAARAFKLYGVHLFTTVLALLTVAGVGALVGSFDMLSRNNMHLVSTEPLAAILGIVTFGHQFGYFNILPLYCVLMLCAPSMIRAAILHPMTLVAISVILWLFAGVANLNFPNFPTDGGWFLNPLSWQLVFMIGIMIGVSVKEGRRFCPYNPVLFALSVAYLGLSCAVVQFSLWDLVLYPHLPEVLFGYNKSFLTLPRLVHVLALAYVVIHMGAVARAANATWSKPIRVLGSNSLAVFATGSVICIGLQTIKSAYPVGGYEDCAILAVGLAAQFVAARWDDIRDATAARLAGQPRTA